MNGIEILLLSIIAWLLTIWLRLRRIHRTIGKIHDDMLTARMTDAALNKLIDELKKEKDA